MLMGLLEGMGMLAVEFVLGSGLGRGGLHALIIDYAAVSSEHMNAVLSMSVDEIGLYGGGFRSQLD